MKAKWKTSLAVFALFVDASTNEFVFYLTFPLGIDLNTEQCLFLL